MRISWHGLSVTRRVGLVGVVLLTAPVSIPLILYNTIRRKLQSHPTSNVVADLRRKLWHGFGETTAAAITEHLAQQRYSRRERAQLASELARWRAADNTSNNFSRQERHKIIKKIEGSDSHDGNAPDAENKFDIVLMSDFSLRGGTRRCNEGYVAAATSEGLRVALFHYPRWHTPLKRISSTYERLAEQPNIELLQHGQAVSAKVVIIHHPPIIQYKMDDLPVIATSLIAVLANQSPMEYYSEAPNLYDPEVVRQNCQHYFGLDPVWIAISGRIKNILNNIGGYTPMLDDIWFPPFLGEILAQPAPPRHGEKIIIGRQSRDHWNKWPADPHDLRAAYCGDQPDIECRILGGIDSQRRALGVLPKNWVIHPFDSIDVTTFIDDLDVFVNFGHHDLVEAFGRNTMEAMARGKPVILDPSLRETFGEAALYCNPVDVSQTLRQLMGDANAYVAQAQKGLDFVRNSCAQERARHNLKNLIAMAGQKTIKAI